MSHAVAAEAPAGLGEPSRVERVLDWVVPGTTTPDVVGAAAMVESLKRRGMLMGKAGQHGNVLKIRPPLVFEQEHAELFLDAFADALGDPAVPASGSVES